MNYYVIYSNTSLNNGGLKLELKVFSDAHIVESAEYEMGRTGESIEDLAGVAFIEDEDGNFVPEREIKYDELVKLSAKKLADDGRVFFVYPMTTDGTKDFVEDAESLNLKDDALNLVLKNLRI